MALAVGDLALNVAMDASMLTGVGEVAMGMHAAVDVGEHLAADAAEHAAEDTIGHAAEDEAEHAAEDGASDALSGSSNCALSFAAGTLVSTSAGLKPIASVKTGDQVTSYDPKVKTASSQTVQATWVTHDTDLLDVTLRPTGTSASATTTTTSKAQRVAVASHGSHAPPSSAVNQSTSSTSQVGDETVHTTANHPFLTADRGWAQAGTLALGEAVVEANGRAATVVALRDVSGTAPMYDLSVSSLHDFAVGTGAYVVHNCDSMDPQEVRFSQDSISPNHGDGNTVQGNIDALKSGELSPDDMPSIRVFEKTPEMDNWIAKGDGDFGNLEDGETYTLDNRRLYEFQQAGIDNVPVAQATEREILRESYKFTTPNGGISIFVRGAR